MEIGMIFEDLTSGGYFIIGDRCDWWILDDGEMVRRSKSHGYSGGRFAGRSLEAVL